MDIVIVVSMIGGAVAALISGLLNLWQIRRKRKVESQLKELSVSFAEKPADSLVESYSEIDADRINYAINNLRNYLVHSSTVQTKQDIETQVNAKVDKLKKRIEEIEARFPQEATLEKIASVNDAILATRLDALSDSIKAIQDRILTKWDVAKIVFAILSALGILVGIIFGVINFVAQ